MLARLGAMGRASDACGNTGTRMTHASKSGPANARVGGRYANAHWSRAIGAMRAHGQKLVPQWNGAGFDVRPSSHRRWRAVPLRRTCRRP
jgi:2,4-dienoyl-CoA reductase-like NADH-dependent reductase (Old Yellow Enzyme family)